MKQWEIRQATVDDDLPVVVPTRQQRPEEVPRVLVEQLPIVAWTTDPVLGFTSAEGAELLDLALGPNQIIGLTLFDLLDTDDPQHPVVAAHMQALFGRTVSFQMRLADRAFLGRVSPLRDGDGEQIGTICAAVEGPATDPTTPATTSAVITVE